MHSDADRVLEQQRELSARLSALRLESDALVADERALHDVLRLLHEKRREFGVIKQRWLNEGAPHEVCEDIRGQEQLLVREASTVGRLLADLLRQRGRLQTERLAVLAAYERLLTVVLKRADKFGPTKNLPRPHPGGRA
jgi:hypothetical protein